MIDIELINKQTNLEKYSIATLDEYPMLFLGFVIKNEYDNLRISLNETYKPLSFFHLGKDRQTGVPLKGIKLTPNDIVKQLMRQIINQEKIGMNLVIYENLLSQYNFACKETYSYFSTGMYPLDFNNLKSICNDTFNTDKKIFQHLLGLDEKVFEFQKFSSLKLFILTV